MPTRSSPPAKRAGIMLFVLGPLTILLGGCMAGIAAAIPRMPSSPDLDRAKQQLTTSTGMPLGEVLTQVTIRGGVLVALGLVLLGLAPFVCRGRKGPIVAAMVLAGLVLLFQGLGLAVALPQMGSVNGIAGVCMDVVLTAPFVLLMVWLVGGLRERPAAVDDYQQQLARWQQYQQAAQAYGGGSGYGAPPTAADNTPPSATGGPYQSQG